MYLQQPGLSGSVQLELLKIGAENLYSRKCLLLSVQQIYSYLWRRMERRNMTETVNCPDTSTRKRCKGRVQAAVFERRRRKGKKGRRQAGTHPGNEPQPPAESASL